ncbi:MAG: hypothetical protein K6A30_02520 [Lachnospiraceae bacterium]|nr:hypothetical protein [Lachnospiraceae bacterium]
MKKVLLYWSNICVLHKYEQSHLEKVKEKLLSEGIDLEIQYFGIGYPTRMSQALLDKEKPLPDLIVSTDLEVFENKEIYGRYCRELYPICNWYSTKKKENYRSLYVDEKLLPFIAIPMMVYTKDPSYKDISLEDLLDKHVAFGGINNSGVKCVYKYIWERFGKEKASDFLSHSQICDMPIQGMQAVRTNAANLALIPSIYALRADMKNEFAFSLTEGNIVLPSFVAARNSLTETEAKTILNTILSPEFCNYFVTNGDLISCMDFAEENRFDSISKSTYLYPDNQWFYKVSPAEFYTSYCEIIPRAKDYSRII